MAKIVQDNIVITVSKIERGEGIAEGDLVSVDVKQTLEQIVTELVGAGFIVEVR